ncbi:hypothetical protein [Candidatus Magnetobacterium casense]|uniref:Secreted protein n=1 Tax=Candidatus Magnetobacterium casense TaxID=1455061 RepID=A0ABS6RXU2_9BACT|nr:hypothetical protein [Candidatus Magnetobacterium casensis]MBV6340623.1 hypothetical protein [Candidatus Magnetobacterium casensis]
MKVASAMVIITVIFVIIRSAGKESEVNIMNNTQSSQRPTIEEVKTRHEMSFFNISGVEGVGIGEESGRAVIKIYVSKQPKLLQDKIPAQIEGYPIVLEFSGGFHAF